MKLYSWKDCLQFDIQQIHKLYRQYINPCQVDLIGSFGFGRKVVTHAEGMYIYTSDNQKYLDFTGGVGVLNHGHNHPRILKARIEYQQQKRMEVHKNFLSPYTAGLSHNIAQLLPEDLNISYFCNSGAEAVEGAVKLAYKAYQGKRKYILHSNIAFHGKLLGSAGLTGSPELHFQFPTIPNRKAFIYNNISSVKTLINTLRQPDGSSDIYAIIIEPMNASSLNQCSTEFLSELRTLCDTNDIVLIFDEVYTGWAKTGELFYFIHHKVTPDIVTMAKSFGGGKSSISGFTSRPKIFEKAYGNLHDAILHSTTYNGFGEECITSMEAIQIIIDENFTNKAQNIHQILNAGLIKLQEKYPRHIKEVRGKGSLNGLIFNDEISPLLKSTLKFIPHQMFQDPRFFSKLITSAVISELFNEHQILTFYGDNREIPLIIAPSLIVSDAELNLFLQAMDLVLSKGFKELVLKFAKFKYSKLPTQT